MNKQDSIFKGYLQKYIDEIRKEDKQTEERDFLLNILEEAIKREEKK